MGKSLFIWIVFALPWVAIAEPLCGFAPEELKTYRLEPKIQKFLENHCAKPSSHEGIRALTSVISELTPKQRTTFLEHISKSKPELQLRFFDKLPYFQSETLKDVIQKMVALKCENEKPHP